MMKRQTEQPHHLLPLPLIPSHQLRRRVRRIDTPGLVADILALPRGDGPLRRMRVQVRQDELHWFVRDASNRYLGVAFGFLGAGVAVGAVAVEGGVEVVLDGRRGPAAAGAEVDVDVGANAGG